MKRPHVPSSNEGSRYDPKPAAGRWRRRSEPTPCCLRAEPSLKIQQQQQQSTGRPRGPVLRYALLLLVLGEERALMCWRGAGAHAGSSPAGAAGGAWRQPPPPPLSAPRAPSSCCPPHPARSRTPPPPKLPVLCQADAPGRSRPAGGAVQ